MGESAVEAPGSSPSQDGCDMNPLGRTRQFSSKALSQDVAGALPEA